MLRLRPFRAPDAKKIITWTSAPEEFYKWSAGILGDYPVSEKRMLEAVSAREDNPKYFPFTAFDEGGPVGFFTVRYYNTVMTDALMGLKKWEILG